jgi:hypothetical protein
MLNVLRSEHFLAATYNIQFVRCERIQPLPADAVPCAKVYSSTNVLGLKGDFGFPTR